MEKKTIAQRVQEWIGIQDKACIQETDVSNIKFEENKSKITFVNSGKAKCYRLQIDGCIIKEGIRCDNMLQSFIYGEALDFDALMVRMRELQRRVRGNI